MTWVFDSAKNDINYQVLLNSTPIIGMWDDHDFGINDAGIENPFK